MYAGRRRKSPGGRRLGRQTNFDFIVIKSAKEKSRQKSQQNNKQTNKQTARKRSRKGELKASRRKKESGKKKKSTKFAAWRSVLVKQFDYVYMSFLSRSINNRKCRCWGIFISFSARSPIFPKYASPIKNSWK